MRNHGFILLWDNDSEGGCILFFVLMKREAASAHSHDLSGERQADAASFRLRGEEWDEDMGGYIVGDESGVVGYVDDDGLLGVGISIHSDKCLLACCGLQIRGVAFLLFFLFGFTFFLFGGFHCILQQICHDVGDEALVSVCQ